MEEWAVVTTHSVLEATSKPKYSLLAPGVPTDHTSVLKMTVAAV